MPSAVSYLLRADLCAEACLEGPVGRLTSTPALKRPRLSVAGMFALGLRRLIFSVRRCVQGGAPWESVWARGRQI